MKIALTDLETTGLNPAIHEIIEIGCVVFDSETFHISDSFNLKVKPITPWTGTDEAFAVNGYDPAEWQDALPLAIALEYYRKHTEGAMFCAHNMIFDWQFLQAASKKTGVPLDFDYHKLDLLSMAYARIPHHKMMGWSLKTICSYLRIQPEPKLHRALQGAMKEYEVYCKLISMV